MHKTGRFLVTLLACLTLSLAFATAAPAAAHAAKLSDDWTHANIYSLSSTSSRSFKLKVDVWNIDVTKGKQLTFSGSKKGCDYYIAKVYYSQGFTKVSYKTFAKYVAKQPGAVCDVKYRWRTNSKGKRYRYAQTVWADGYAR